MTTPVEFLPPTSIPDEGWLSRLALLLGGRSDTTAAYPATTRYFDPETLQDELHFELSEPREEGGAPAALFHEMGNALGEAGVSDFVFTFPPRAILCRARDAGALLRSREKR